jgi:glycosyltransferase involved in cell wall biosynthesis
MSTKIVCSKASLPTVTIAIPTYNEADCIKKVIKGFFNNTYDNLVEILVGDGGSTDNTREIVEQLSLIDARVKLINNPEQLQSSALNLMLKEAKGDIFLRADAHCDYALDYIEKCVEALQKTKAINVGGAQRFVATEAFQSGVALASKSLLGHGGAKYRNILYNGYADTVFLGCFWKQDLLKLGGYANQNTNEDAELNLRLRKINSESIYISSDIKVEYFPRKTWSSLFKQYFRYGRGRYLTGIKHKDNLQIRGKLSFLFVFTVVTLLFLDFLFSKFNLPIKEFIITLIVIPLAESCRVIWEYKNSFATEIWRGQRHKIPSLLSSWFYCSITLWTLPLAHFSGYGYQLLKHKFLRIQQW